jgi:2Fe-2S ferredoxin
MPRITFTQPDGTATTLDAGDLPTPMHAAVRHDLPNLPAECGGQGVCVTCMADVDAAWVDRLPPPGPDECDMLADALGDVPPARRLSCQIRLTPALDGLILHLPPRQR